MIASHLPYSKELQMLRELSEELALREAASFLARLVREPGFLETEILPLFEGGKGASDWYVASRYEGKDGSFSLQVFIWPTGPGTRIHDHFPGVSTAAPSAPRSRSATSASTTVRGQATPG